MRSTVSVKIMLFGVMLMILGTSFDALGLEWVVFIAGFILGIGGLFWRTQGSNSGGITRNG